jgi:hypothetical protein
MMEFGLFSKRPEPRMRFESAAARVEYMDSLRQWDARHWRAELVWFILLVVCVVGLGIYAVSYLEKAKAEREVVVATKQVGMMVSYTQNLSVPQITSVRTSEGVYVLEGLFQMEFSEPLVVLTTAGAGRHMCDAKLLGCKKMVENSSSLTNLGRQ